MTAWISRKKNEPEYVFIHDMKKTKDKKDLGAGSKSRPEAWTENSV